ncbi:MAG: hypothetical protein SWE60_25500, partial [Thermodesulfobacteriota bacterium]|nr:hypothetical protein [Thermodesulfobacteriota bacterium]
VGREHRSLSEALADLDDNPYLCRSKYAMQLEQYMKYVPESRVLIMAQEDLYRHREETLQRVFRFLEVDASFHCEAFSHIKHPSRGKRRRRHGAASIDGLSEGLLERLPPSTAQSLSHLLHLSLSRKIEQPVLEEQVRKRVIDALKDDAHRFTQWTGLRFGSWQGL